MAREHPRAHGAAPRSSSSGAERRLWSKLRDGRLGGRIFRRQHPIGPFVADFACVDAGLVVELDGGGDADAVGITADARRSTFFHLQGFTTLRFSRTDVLADTESVLASIAQWLNAHPSSPEPLPQAALAATKERA